MSDYDVLEDIDFGYECRKILKDELRRHGLTYRSLAEILQKHGLEETEKSIAHKAMRGTFRLSFLLQVMRVLGTETLVVPVPKSKRDLVRSTSFHEA
ncbi:DUF6471 domain-containing protein [Paraburkholderia terrae]|uniref:DUF6471 domain-containing protein n=1 Tax=Paraburkholderia terrae TaxID=311230 RepID=UPI0005A86EFC|nr:DUF6471 domain-containing protein [Paraburkholderia terrae]